MRTEVVERVDFVSVNSSRGVFVLRYHGECDVFESLMLCRRQHEKLSICVI